MNSSNPLSVGSKDMGGAGAQPALVSDQAATRLAPSGFDQAQAGKLHGCTICWGGGFDMLGNPCPFAAQHRLASQALEARRGEIRNGARSRSDDIAVREADAPNPSSLQNKAPIHEG